MVASVAEMEALRITHLSKSVSFVDELQPPNGEQNQWILVCTVYRSICKSLYARTSFSFDDIWRHFILLTAVLCSNSLHSPIQIQLANIDSINIKLEIGGWMFIGEFWFAPIRTYSKLWDQGLSITVGNTYSSNTYRLIYPHSPMFRVIHTSHAFIFALVCAPCMHPLGHIFFYKFSSNVWMDGMSVKAHAKQCLLRRLWPLPSDREIPVYWKNLESKV